MFIKFYREGLESKVSNRKLAEHLGVNNTLFSQWKKTELNAKKLDLLKKGVVVDKLPGYSVKELTDKFVSAVDKVLSKNDKKIFAEIERELRIAIKEKIEDLAKGGR